MPRRVKEEERAEMIIRGLLKQPENRRCVNCNSLGPQYVCTTYWTFVCTNCSGVHREFTHRVKSVSMAKFNDEEILALQAGGNERARQIYFKEWDPQRNCYPDASNLQRLREFVKNVYLDRRYAGGFDVNDNNSGGKFPTIRSVNNAFSAGERSSYERAVKEKNLKELFEERSPRNNSGQRGRAAARFFEIVDDRFRDDGSVKKYERNKSSSDDNNNNNNNNNRRSSLPSVRHVRDLLGEKGPDLKKVGEPPSKEDKGSPSTTSVSKVAEAQKQTETMNQINLIDFEDIPEPEKPTANVEKKVEPLLFNLSMPEKPSTDNSSQIGPLEQSFLEMEPNISARMELPADLFMSNLAGFAPPPPQAATWQTQPYHGPLGGFSRPSNPRNPFDFVPSMAPIEASSIPYGEDAFASIDPIHHQSNSSALARGGNNPFG